jgi:hypothetical protein
MIGSPPKQLAVILSAPFASLGETLDRRTAKRHGCNLRVGRVSRYEAGTKQQREQFCLTRLVPGQ